MIYLFDKDEKLIKIVRKSAVKTALQKYALTTERYVSDRLTVESKGLNADELEQVEYMAIQTMEDAHTFHYFYVAQKFSDELTTLIGVQSGIEELRKSPVYDKRPQNAFARDVITDLLAGTNWQARFVGETTAHSTNFYYTSVFDALKKVCEVWDLEMQFFVEMNGNRIGGRYIDFKQRIGEAVGKRVVYGHNALQILQEVERTNIFTALIGRGKGEETSESYGRKITFENVVWSTIQGKPVNKPAGQKYLELPLMTRQYGIKNADGSMRPKIGFVDFSEEENPEVLIERTYKALVDAARPQLTLKTSSVYLKGVKVGDTIRVVRHDKKLDYDTRIFEITFNRLNNQSSDIKLGDRIGESNEAKVQTIADKAVEQFVNNEFSNFVQNLPDYLPSADGFNNNWYGAEDPTVQYPGKVLINDIWYKPDSEHEGHRIMLRWTGEVWEEILRTYDSEALRDRIAEEIAQVNTSMQAQSEEHDRQVADILSKTQSVEELANQAKTDAANAVTEAIRLDTIERQATETKVANAKSQAIAEATQMVETAKSLLSGQISNVSTDLSQTKEAIKLLATTATVDALTGRISSAESTLQVQAGEIASRVKTSDFDQAKQRISTAESSINQLGNRITTEIGTVEGKIPTSIGERNLAQKTSSDWSNPYTSFNGSINNCPRLYTILVDDLAVGDTLKSRIVLKYTNIVPASGQTARIWLQGDGNVTGWNNGRYTDSTYTSISGSGEMVFEHEFKISADHLKNDYWNWMFRTDYIASGSLQWRLAKVEKGTVFTGWSPAPEDIANEISSVKTTITQTSQGVEQLSTSLSTTNSKVTTAETKINQLISDVSSKVSQTDYNTLTGRVSSAETAITQNATEISKRLTSTQVSQTILIDKQIKDTRSDNQSPQWYWTNYPKQTVEEFKSSAVIGLTSESTYAILTTNVHWADSSGGKIKQTAKTDCATFERYGTGTTWEAWTKIANASDLAKYTTKTEFQTVKETTSLYERVIGSTEANVKDKIARIVMADSLFMTEVKNKVDGTSTQVTQLSGSYAIKNLTGSGTVLNQLNLNKDGSIKIDGSLVQITGTTYIQDGVISSAKIANLDAGKVTTGTLNSARIATNSITGSHIVFDQAFFNRFMANEAYLQQLFAKNAFITQVQAVTLSASKISGGILTATNGAMEISMNAGQIIYYTDSAALKRILSGYPTQFIKFETGTVEGKGSAGVTVIGSNRNGTESSNDGGFVGIRAWNGSNIDSIDVVGDSVRLASSTYYSADGWNVVTLPNKLEIDAYNSNHRASSRAKVGDVWLWKNASTYSSMRDTINLIIDNLQLLHNNKTTEKGYSYTMPAKV